MASESRPTRAHQGSSLAFDRPPAAHHARHPSRHVAKPKSAHTSDPFLADFLGAAFDPAEYLNNTLPLLRNADPSAASARTGQQAVPLTELSGQAQALSSQLNAHMTRLSDTLTQLTDEILRSGSRLAYEVELLRGETLSLAEAFTEGLREDVETFVPGGLEEVMEARAASAPDARPHRRRSSTVPPTTPRAVTLRLPPPPTPGSATPSASEEDLKDEPPYVSQLHVLTVARSRLDRVIRTFGDAMEFAFPPSEMSVGSSFLSVSAPEPGASRQSSEEKGQQVLRALRGEVARLLADPEDPVRGIERAAQRVEELRGLAGVWKGTAEEKGRTKFVDGLVKLVEDKHRDLLRDVEQQARRGGGGEAEAAGARPRKGSVPTADGGAESSKGHAGGYGLLQRLRGGL